MKKLLLSIFVAFSMSCAVWSAPLHYPTAPHGDQVDDYHGVKVADPYRALENPDTPVTRAWITAENAVTHKFLASIPQRDAIRKRIAALWNYERFGTPWKEGGRYFYFHNDGLQNQSVLFTAATLNGKPRILLDPNKLSSDGTVALDTWSVSLDGRYLAYGLSTAGSDWTEFRVRRVDDGKDLRDDLKWVKFSGASWLPDNSGFFYSRYDEPKDPSQKLRDANYFQKVYFHRIGTPQSDDVLVYERPDEKEWGFGAIATRDGHYVVIQSNQGTDPHNRVFLLDLTAHPLPGAGGRVAPDAVVPVLDKADATYDYVDNDGSKFWFFSTANAPRGELLAIDVLHPYPEQWKTIVPQGTETLLGVSLVGDRFFAEYMQDAHTAIRMFDLHGRAVGSIALPGLGNAGGFPGHRTDQETFYSFTSFTTPTTIYRYDIPARRSSIYRKPRVAFDPANYVTRQVFYHSKDGTRVPMFITARKGVRLDGHNPTLLYGYGGFNISILPSFSPANLVWMEMGGVYAVANIRGGGEYGEAWHEAGMKLHKQNVFDDFIAAAEWLIKNRYTTREKLAISGRSNGGLLIGAVMTQRPDLFGAALPGVGVLDMLRFNKFTIGWAWTADYGSPENPQDFRALYQYSPLHHVKAGTHYPATLIVTADHDDRVVPAHSFKFAAALQAAQAGDAPVLIRIETRAGHGAGKPMTKIIGEVSDEWAFLVRVLQMSPPRI